MKKYVKTEFTSKQLLVSGIGIFILIKLFEFFLGDNNIILHGFDSLASFLVICGIGQFYISNKLTNSKIIAFALGFITYAILMLIMKWLFQTIF